MHAWILRNMSRHSDFRSGEYASSKCAGGLASCASLPRIWSKVALPGVSMLLCMPQCAGLPSTQNGDTENNLVPSWSDVRTASQDRRPILACSRRIFLPLAFNAWLAASVSMQWRSAKSPRSTLTCAPFCPERSSLRKAVGFTRFFASSTSSGCQTSFRSVT